LARESRSLIRRLLQECDAYLSATLARARYLRATGRLADPESATDIATLEAEQERVKRRLARLRPGPATARLPDDPADQLALATRREVARYREAVSEDSRRLRARSAALRLRSRAARRLRLLQGGLSLQRPRAG
jgi:hypothetical protein